MPSTAAVQSGQSSDRLSWGDTVFLHLEREGMPLNVASVCIFEGEISLSDCIRLVQSKLPLLPRYLKRVVSAPFGLGFPSWEYDPNFDVRLHVREAALKHGTETELKAFAGKLFGQIMDRRHPLWDITLVHGVKDRTAFLIRMHHCLADGIAGVGIMNILLDASPGSPLLASQRKKIRFTVPPPRDPMSALMGGIAESYSDVVQRILSAIADLLSMGERTALNGEGIKPEELASLWPELTAFTERLRFNVLYTGPQKFAWADISLPEVKAIRQVFDVSVNDVVLALLTATIRRYAEFHGDPVKGRLFRMMVPVNLRGTNHTGELGNRISIVPVTIPLDIHDPRKLLHAVHRRTEFLKQVHAAELVSLTSNLIGMLPIGLQAAIGPFVSRLPVTPFNLVCTNIPGPQEPLYLLGHKMLRWYPYVPIGGEMAVNCAVLSYDGNIGFGFSGDVHAAPDLRRLEGLLNVSFAELREAAGIQSQQRQSTPKRKTPRVATQATTSKSDSKNLTNVRGSVPLTVPAPLADAAQRMPLAKEEKVLATVA